MALLSSFAELAQSRRYSEIGVDAIARAAKVARSTFYYHFRTKDDLLLENLAPLIAALAAAAISDAPPHALDQWIEHIGQHRAQAGRVLTGRTGAKLHKHLVTALRLELGNLQPDQPWPPIAIVAEQIAGSSMALLQAWASNRVNATPETISRALWEFCRRGSSSRPL